MVRAVLATAAVLFGGTVGFAPVVLAEAAGHLRAVAGERPVQIGPDIIVTPGEDEIVDGQEAYYEAVRAAIRAELSKRPRDAGREPLTMKISVSFGRPGSAIGLYDRRDSLSRFGDLPRPMLNAQRGTGDLNEEIVDQFQIPLGEQGGPPISAIALALFLYDQRGNTLWTATISATGEIRDPAHALGRMARAAMAVVGSHAQRDFLLWCDEADTAANRALCLK